MTTEPFVESTAFPLPPTDLRQAVPARVHSPALRAVTSLSVALVSADGVVPTALAGIANRPVREPCEISEYDDILLFYGAGMAQELERFTASAEKTLPPAVFLVPQLDWRDVFLSLHHGAVCYLLENRNAVPLADVLICACRGVSLFDSGIAAELFRITVKTRAQEVSNGRSGTAAAFKGLPRLTSREGQIINLLASGCSVGDVSRELVLSTRTVRNHLSRIYSKLGVRSQTEAILCWLGHLEPAARRERGHA
ncbi:MULTISPECIES: response regulator transcription factor [unclassified Streptomyces]|uniref:helix-turn-helix transcriptional regulator n=1 Tax=unclassified Streptomyces TaxID=2593676 RepID=UPI0013A6C410|nr:MULTISPECIES: response regulator transcription factor [unclassified Streptomyces]QZZ31971.1 response regulator transcription factor [Streptomyces sp. ST1015]